MCEDNEVSDVEFWIDSYIWLSVNKEYQDTCSAVETVLDYMEIWLFDFC